MFSKSRSTIRDNFTGHADRIFPKGTRRSSPFGHSPARTLSAIALLMLITAGCGPTRCLNVAAFGNLGPQVNSPYDDYAPALSDTAALVFTSNRIEPGEGGLQQFYESVRPTRLFFTMRLDEDWDEAQVYRLLFNGEGPATEAATISFAPAGSPFNTVAYVSACMYNDSSGGCDLFAVVERQGSGLVNLGGEINSAAWDGHPFVTRDGKRLYFASDRAGGLGGNDLWFSERLSSGAWGTPRNMGPAVNTSGDELSPFFDDINGNLYFASATQDTGLDIFIVEPGSSKPRRLPPPYNSEYDDFTPFLLNGWLYLASNRGGGCGGYDLYAFAMGEVGGK